MGQDQKKDEISPFFTLPSVIVTDLSMGIQNNSHNGTGSLCLFMQIF